MTTESGFDCFASLNANEKTELKNVLQEITKCIQLRFDCPWSSVHMKGLFSSTFQSTTQQNRQSLQQLQCSVSETFDLLNFPRDLFLDNSFTCAYSLLDEDEIERMRSDLNDNKTPILNAYHKRVEEMSQKVGFGVESRLCLTDVFQVVEGRDIPCCGGR